MESKRKNKESKSYKQGKANALLWKVTLNTKGKVESKLKETTRQYKNYLLEVHLNNVSEVVANENINNYLGFIDELESWLQEEYF